METEERQGPPRGFVLGMVLVMVVTVGGLAGVFVFRLQPPLSTGGGSCASGSACVIMPSNAAVANFSPFNMTVVIGVNSTVLWTNRDTIQHTVVVCPVGGGQVCSPSKAVGSSPILSQGDTFQFSFNSAGVYHFYCSIHPTTMRGTIVVKAGGAPAS